MYSLGKTPLRYFKTLGVYKNSSGTNQFNPESMSAYSYGWWKYVARINGKVVFNGFNYSTTTGKHQHRMLTLLHQLGIKIDMHIEAPRGLDDTEQTVKYNIEKYFKARSKYQKARKPHTKENAKCAQENALAAITFLKGHTSFIESLRYLVYNHEDQF